MASARRQYKCSSSVQDEKGQIYIFGNEIDAVFARKQSTIYMLENSQWVEVPGNHEALPSEPILILWDGILHSVGGWKNDNPVKQVLSLNGKTWKISKIIPSIPDGCCRACIIDLKEVLVVLGGRESGPRLSGKVQVYNRGKKQWHQGQTLPLATESPSAAVYGDTIFVAGGCCMGPSIWSAQLSEVMKEGKIQDSIIWNVLHDLPCTSPLVYVIDEQLMVCGGYNNSKPSDKSSVHVYTGSQQWQRIENIEANALYEAFNGDVVIIHENSVTTRQKKDLCLPQSGNLKRTLSSFTRCSGPSTEHYINFYDLYYPSDFDASIRSLYVAKNVPTLADLFLKLNAKGCLLKGKLSHDENDLHGALRHTLFGSLPYDYSQLETLDTRTLNKISWDDDLGFAHLSVQHCFAAMAIMKLPLFDQMYLLTSPYLNRNVCIFYSSLAYSSYDEQLCSTAKKILPQMLDGIIRHPEANMASSFLTAINCLYQAQDSSLCKTFLSRHVHLLCSSITIGTKMTYSDIISLNYFVKHSGSSWEIEVEDLNYYCILRDCCKVSVSDKALSLIKCTNTQLLNKKPPKAQITGVRGLLQSLCCETLSELLYNVIAFCSPTPVLCTSRGPGYISYVSCPCLKSAVLKYINFEPILATHWVPGDAKHFKTLQFTGDQHSEVHKKELTELVILVSPLPVSIMFTIPGTEESVSINISTNSKYLEDVDDSEISVKYAIPTDPIDSETYPMKDELVAPPFLLNDSKLSQQNGYNGTIS